MAYLDAKCRDRRRKLACFLPETSRFNNYIATKSTCAKRVPQRSPHSLSGIRKELFPPCFILLKSFTDIKASEPKSHQATYVTLTVFLKQSFAFSLIDRKILVAQDRLTLDIQGFRDNVHPITSGNADQLSPGGVSPSLT
ncbi:hypothetical protein N7G274_001487 [Stereocaulon virgatum]|uniref:Uncharacterized protein n=1 Tax=Stereocaulon virgatum TaxID=373712 RepID=A0ABR4AJU5_9LECA